MQAPQEIKRFSRFIYNKPEVVVKILNDNGYRTSDKVTLSEIIDKTANAIAFADQKFIEAFDLAYSNADYNIAGAIVGGAFSLASSIIGSRQAKKQRELQARISLAKLETERLISEEEIRMLGETERTRILANSLTEYRKALQGESTERQKNVYIYLIAIGLGIAIIYSSTVLIKEG